MTAALFYHPEAYTTSGPKLMGRHAAGESFLRGYLQYSTAQTHWLQLLDPAHGKAFAQQAQAYGRNEPIRAVTAGQLQALSEPGVVYHPGPGLGEHAWKRGVAARLKGHSAYSLCGITHTTSSAAAMDGVVDLITAPVQPWDALICTSQAVKRHVEVMLQAQANYLQQRLGIQRLVLPQLPVIPLGVHADDFAFTAEEHHQSRAELGIQDDEGVALFVGRLSFHAKAHPLAMYLALEQAAQTLSQRLVLVECGWHANEHIEKAFDAAAHMACPSVRRIVLDGRKPELRKQAWSCADVFCSLSDNIQETFGITPVEAMAAGLPVVVSDWDGYKDTVTHGQEGFRIPTRMPPAGLGQDLAIRHALEVDRYDLYCGYNSAYVEVDVQACAGAFKQLFESPELRRRMGEAGRARVRSQLDWRQIIPAYEALWEQLRALRPSEASVGLWPARLDPFAAFAHYPTSQLAFQSRLTRPLDEAGACAQLDAVWALSMVQFAQPVLSSIDELRSLLSNASSGPLPVAQLLEVLPAERRALGLRSLVWLCKFDLLRVWEEPSTS